MGAEHGGMGAEHDGASGRGPGAGLAPGRRPRSASRVLLAVALTGTIALSGCVSVAAPGGSAAGPASSTTAPPIAPNRTSTATPEPAPPAADATAAPDAPGPAGATPTPATGTALATLALLDVKGRAPQTGYDRDLFAYRAVDLDRNGCDTRNDILRRDLVDQTVGRDGCVVDSGTLADPYSGTTIAFRRGQSTSGDVQIDHVVALADAWQKGAQRWDASTLESFGNDPLNLLAVDGPLNQSKGAGDAATWLPPNRAYRCAYVARQVAVKRAYGLWVTAAERDAIARVLATCPDEPLPSADTSGWAPASAGPAQATQPPAENVDGDEGGDEQTYYASCAQARAAGVAPLHRGDPGYRAGLDRDGDGIACE